VACNDDGVMGGVRAGAGRRPREQCDRRRPERHLACDEWKKPEPTGFRATIYNRSASHGEFAIMAMYNHIKYGVPLPVFIQRQVPVTPDNMSVMDFPSCGDN
jgi:hypothetical protein